MIVSLSTGIGKQSCIISSARLTTRSCPRARSVLKNRITTVIASANYCSCQHVLSRLHLALPAPERNILEAETYVCEGDNANQAEDDIATDMLVLGSKLTSL